jgi:hypothetical protein
MYLFRLKLFQSVFFIFVMGFFFEEIFHFAKKAEFSLKRGWGTLRIQHMHIITHKNTRCACAGGTAEF